MKKLLFVLLSTMALNATAQNYGLLAGISSNNIDKNGNPAVKSEIGWRAGVIGMFDLTSSVNLRTGVTYTDRSFSIKETNTDAKVKYTYIDIPVLFQFQMNDMVGIYAGPVVAINSGKKVSGTLNGSATNSDVTDMKSIYLLGQVGANFNFDGIGFDVYYERGFGVTSTDGYKDYSIIGANFVLWL